MNQHGTKTYTARITKQFDPAKIIFEAHHRRAVLAHIVEALGIEVDAIDGPRVADILEDGGVRQKIVKNEKAPPEPPPGLGLGED